MFCSFCAKWPQIAGEVPAIPLIIFYEILWTLFMNDIIQVMIIE